MAPKAKGKGGSKKAKEKERLLELERLAEEQRLADIAEAERQEKLRLEREEEERLRQIEEARLQAELDARIEVEDRENAEAYKAAENALKMQLAESLEGKAWQRYVRCDDLPEISSESSVNTFLTDWEESKPQDIWKTVSDCELGFELQEELLLDAAAAAERGDDRQAAWQTQLQHETDRVCAAKIDSASADYLTRAEEFANAKNEVICQIATPRFKFGLWLNDVAACLPTRAIALPSPSLSPQLAASFLEVNLAKNPRVKSIDFTELQLSTELPKSLALASIAIRATHMTADRLSRPPAEKATGAADTTAADTTAAGTGAAPLMSVGGVLSLELLSLPPPAKKVRGWTMRQVTELSYKVHRQQYPPPIDGSATSFPSAAGLKITLLMPRNVVVPDEERTVGWFDQASGTWKTDGIAEVDFDKESRVLSFTSVSLSSLALLQRTDLELPYKNWLFTPTDSTSGKLVLETQRRILEFAISASGCKLVGPMISEFESILDVWMPPPRLLLLLRESGVNLCPTDAEAAGLAKLRPKESAMEAELHAAVVDLVPVLQLAPSKWNQTRGADKAMLRFAIKKEELDIDIVGEEPSAKSPFHAVDGSWQTMVYAHRYVALVKALDADAVCDMALLDDAVAHSTPLLCVRDTYPELVHELARTSKLYLEQMRQLLQKLRLLSFTK